MREFTISANEFLNKETPAYYRYDYLGYQKEGNPDFINHLKNQFGDTSHLILEKAISKLGEVLIEDLATIKDLYNTYLTVCVVPRAKAESYYSDDQKQFKKVVSSVVNYLRAFENGTDYIIRIKNTKTTHLIKSGYGGDGPEPYPGITKDTCEISSNVRGKDILLIDDIYTRSVNVDEDAIQALLDNGAKSVVFYSVAKTLKRYNLSNHPQVNVNDFPF